MMTQRKQVYPMAIVVIAIIFGAGEGLIIGLSPTSGFASPSSGSTDQGGAKMHLGEAMKALQAGDTAGAEMHMTEADKVLQEGEAKMHLGEAMKALQAGDTDGAEMHAQMAQIVCS